MPLRHLIAVAHLHHWTTGREMTYLLYALIILAAVLTVRAASSKGRNQQ